MIYFLDTNVCIYHLNGSAPGLSDALERIPTASIRLPSMVAAELMYGAEKSVKRDYNLKKMRLFLSLYNIVPFDRNAVEIYGVIRNDLERSGTIIGANDLIIAATAMANNGILVTHNIDEFSRVIGLQIEDWV